MESTRKIVNESNQNIGVVKNFTRIAEFYK